MKTITAIERSQLAKKLNDATELSWPTSPRGGWVKATRKALGMSGTALSQRLGGSASMAANVQRREQNESISLGNLRETAEAMGCRLVYAIVPPQGSTTETLIQEQAMQRAQELLQQAAGQMALEAQSLNPADQQAELLRLASELASKPPRTFWHPTANDSSSTQNRND